MRKLFGLAAAAAIGLVSAGSAHAAAIQINASNGHIQFSACDFEYGLTVNGASIGSSCGAGYGGTINLPSTVSSVSFSGSWYTPGAQTDVGLTTVYFVTGDQISDILTYSFTDNGSQSTVTGTFTSGLGASLGSLPVGATVVDSTTTFNFGYAFMGADVNGSVVPEPASVALVGGALALLGASRRRRS